MTNSIFVAYGDNVMIERISSEGNTAKGRVLSSNFHDLKYGDIILYQDNEWNEIIVDGKEMDVIWRPKIRCILFKKGE